MLRWTNFRILFRNIDGMTTLFTKIVNGSIPSYRIYEDEYTYAFLDITPKTRGHLLIVPKRVEIADFEELPAEEYVALMQTAQHLARVLKRTFSPRKVALLIEGLQVPHVHVHLIPIESDADLHADLLELGEREMEDIQRLIIQNIE